MTNFLVNLKWDNKYSDSDMLINPVKTKSTVITARQRHQLSDFSLRLLLNSQDVENVTEHRLLGLTVDKQISMASPD